MFLFLNLHIPVILVVSECWRVGTAFSWWKENRVRSSETSSCLFNIKGNCFLPVGCRSGYIHPDKEGHGLQGRAGADYWGRSEPTGSRHPSLLGHSGRTHCIPMWDIRLWSHQVIPPQVCWQINNEMTCLCICLVALQRRVHLRRMSSLRTPLWRPTASSDCWMTNWSLTMTSGGKFLAVLCWSQRRSAGFYLNSFLYLNRKNGLSILVWPRFWFWHWAAFFSEPVNH